VSLKNWDNKTWLSSPSYIKSFNNFLLKQIKLNKNSQILDIGCGRGKILGSLSSKLSLNRKPIGLDIVKHKDRDKRIIFKKIDALRFLKKNKKKFDLILLKQTIHLFKIKDIKNILKFSKKMLNINGKIIIFTLSAVLAGIAGALYVPQVGIINPGEFSPIKSIEIVVWVALGGRGFLYGAIIGAIVVNILKSYLTIISPEIWIIFLGLIFILVTIYLPNGLTDLKRIIKKKLYDRE